MKKTVKQHLVKYCPVYNLDVLIGSSIYNKKIRSLNLLLKNSNILKRFIRTLSFEIVHF